MGMISNLVNRSRQLRLQQEKTIKRQKIKSLALGTGIGTLLGLATGLLFAPSSGEEMRQGLSDKTSEAIDLLKKKKTATKAKTTK